MVLVSAESIREEGSQLLESASQNAGQTVEMLWLHMRQDGNNRTISGGLISLRCVRMTETSGRYLRHVLWDLRAPAIAFYA